MKGRDRKRRGGTSALGRREGRGGEGKGREKKSRPIPQSFEEVGSYAHKTTQFVSGTLSGLATAVRSIGRRVTGRPVPTGVDVCGRGGADLVWFILARGGSAQLNDAKSANMARVGDRAKPPSVGHCCRDVSTLVLAA